MDTLRSLAGTKGSVELDYTVFAMGVMTMSFLLIVEAGRRTIDSWAKSNDFFDTVLKSVYHELATLGIVEATIFIIHQYFEVNYKKEKIFADVHFTLFFVAIINAFISCVMYTLSMHVAERTWVKMETLDANHYLAIRAEFQLVKQQLQRLEKASRPGILIHSPMNNPLVNMVSFIGLFLKKPFQMLRFRGQSWVKEMLRKKYNNFIVQIKFHDLRVHFIEKHNLPSNFRIAEYLKLAMNDHFKDCVHISTRTWLGLMVLTNFLYFTMGIITFFTSTESSYDHNEIVPYCLSWIHLSSCIAFVIISSFTAVKLENIFNAIMQKDLYVQLVEKSVRSVNGHSAMDDSDNDSIDLGFPQQHHAVQEDLFWFGRPDLIITLAQLMQFLFSVGFAILLIIGKNVVRGSIFDWWGWYIIVPIIAFFIYVSFWGVIMPVFTQCTSLGELVSERQLIEVDAFAKLEEERNLRQDKIDKIMAEKEVTANMKQRKQKCQESVNKMKRVMSRTSLSERSAKADEDLKQISQLVKTSTKDILNEISTRSAQQLFNNGSHSQMQKSLSIDSTDSNESSGNDSFFDDPITSQSSKESQALPNPIMSVLSYNSLQRQINLLLLHPSYQIASAIFGTMSAFYIIALRVQFHLINSCVMKDLDNIWTFGLDLPSSFWLLISIFCLFLAESLIVIIIFNQGNNEKHHFMVVAGALDILLTLLCFGMFLLAEVNRCCDCNNNAEIASSSENNRILVSYGTDDKYEEQLSCTFNPTCCPGFGTRACGGLGLLEPFSSLIALRLFRFFIAKHSTCCMQNSSDSDNEEPCDGYRNSSKNQDISQQTGTLAELWVLALTKYNDVTSDYGIFSGNLLESMLGIKPLPKGHEHIQHKSRLGNNTLLTAPRYSNLRKRNSQISGLTDTIGHNIREEDVSFDRPFAKIVHCMRRCYCKWHPFLSDEWKLVDVVLTEYELVWFDTKVDIGRLSSIDIEVLESVKQKLSNTSKETVVLNDAAFGRTVLGRVSLATLDYTKVERKLPQISRSSTNSQKADGAFGSDEENIKQPSLHGSEYWSNGTISTLTDDEKKWFENYTIHDQLKMESHHGSLVLWFVEDINKSMELGGHTNIAISSMKDYESEALSWCKEIVNLAGNSKPRQSTSQGVIQNLVEVTGQKAHYDYDEKGSLLTYFGNFFQR